MALLQRCRRLHVYGFTAYSCVTYGKHRQQTNADVCFIGFVCTDSANITPGVTTVSNIAEQSVTVTSKFRPNRYINMRNSVTDCVLAKVQCLVVRGLRGLRHIYVQFQQRPVTHIDASFI